MENINLLRKIAWDLHKTTQMNFDELFSEACLYYLTIKHSYCPEVGSLSSFIWKSVKNHLISFMKKEKWDDLNIDTMDLPENLICYQPHSFADFYEELPKECLELVDFVLNIRIPDDLPPKMARGQIAKLLKEHGWPARKIHRDIKNLKLALNQI